MVSVVCCVTALCLACNATLQLGPVATELFRHTMTLLDSARPPRGRRVERFSATAGTLSDTSCWFGRVRSLAAALMTTVVLMGIVWPLAGASAGIERSDTSDKRDNHASRLIPNTGQRGHRNFLRRRLDASVSDEHCVASALWEKKLDPGVYKYDCYDIEVCAHTHKNVLFSCAMFLGLGSNGIK